MFIHRVLVGEMSFFTALKHLMNGCIFAVKRRFLCPLVRGCYWILPTSNKILVHWKKVKLQARDPFFSQERSNIFGEAIFVMGPILCLGWHWFFSNVSLTEVSTFFKVILYLYCR